MRGEGQVKSTRKWPEPAPRPTPLRGPLYTRLALPFFRRDMDAGAARTTSSSPLTQLFAEDGSVQGTTLLSKELIHQFCEKRIPEQDALKQIPADMAKAVSYTHLTLPTKA